MTRIAAHLARLLGGSAYIVLRASAVLTCAAVLVAQVRAVDVASATLGGASLSSAGGLFAVLGFAETLLYAVLVVALVAPAARARGAEERIVGDLDGDAGEPRWRVRLWLIGWLATLMALRALLAQLPGVAAPPLGP